MILLIFFSNCVKQIRLVAVRAPNSKRTGERVIGYVCTRVHDIAKVDFG